MKNSFASYGNKLNEYQIAEMNKRFLLFTLFALSNSLQFQQIGSVHRLTQTTLQLWIKCARARMNKLKMESVIKIRFNNKTIYVIKSSTLKKTRASNSFGCSSVSLLQLHINPIQTIWYSECCLRHHVWLICSQITTTAAAGLEVAIHNENSWEYKFNNENSDLSLI